MELREVPRPTPLRSRENSFINIRVAEALSEMIFALTKITTLRSKHLVE
jgi:hypothetical protein